MNFGDQLKRIRRMLRDPNANIWTRGFLKTAYNDVQRDLQRRTRILDQVAVLHYPPRYQIAFTHDWEWTYLPSGQSRFFQCLRYHNQSDYSFCHKWEAQTDYGTDGVVDDVGIQFTQPWEAFISEDPCIPIAIKFPDNFHTTKFLAYDRQPLEYLAKKQITLCDSSYQTRSGTPVYYYREDDHDNSFIPYPRPSTVTWEDDTQSADTEYVYSHSWESDYATGEQFTRDDDDNDRTYVQTWELDIGTGTEEFMRGMWLFEVGTESAGALGQVIYTEDDTGNVELGTVMRIDGSIVNQDEGIAIDILGIDDEFLLVYDSEPTEIQNDTDESDFPVFLRKYIEYGVLERAYGSLTDGKIASLKDYWGTRYQIGVEALKLYKLKRKTDRDYCLKSKSLPSRRAVRHARLPSSYPSV